jgi:negative regulator of sigma E activity
MRTWDENRAAINQLWPVATFTEEEKKLWSDDLSRLDQVTLYDAIRNAKRTHDSVYPQLKWVLDDYRGLYTTKMRALRPGKAKEEKLLLKIDGEQNRIVTEEMMALVDESGPHDFDIVETTVLDNLPRMHAVSAMRVLNYARERLLGQRQLFGRVTDSGDIQPINFGGTLA